MEQTPDWQSMINVNISDHEVRLRVIEAILEKNVDFDDMDKKEKNETREYAKQLKKYSEGQK